MFPLQGMLTEEQWRFLRTRKGVNTATWQALNTAILNYLDLRLLFSQQFGEVGKWVRDSQTAHCCQLTAAPLQDILETGWSYFVVRLVFPKDVILPTFVPLFLRLLSPFPYWRRSRLIYHTCFVFGRWCVSNLEQQIGYFSRFQPKEDTKLSDT
jgi:hypothetical protein